MRITAETKYIILQKSAKMPSSCWGKYGKLALVELADESIELSEYRIYATSRSRHVKQVIWLDLRLYCGGARSAYARELRTYQDRCAELNRAWRQRTLRRIYRRGIQVALQGTREAVIFVKYLSRKNNLPIEQALSVVNDYREEKGLSRVPLDFLLS